MRYLVDIEVTVKVKGVMIDVDNFDQKGMATAAMQKWMDSLLNG